MPNALSLFALGGLTEMPAIIAAGAAAFVSSAIGSSFVISATTFLAAGVSMALSGLSLILSGNTSKASSAESTSEGITRSFREARAQRQFVYGEVRKSGSIAYLYGSTDNRYLHIVTRLASHEIDGIDEYLINDESITPDMLDSDGNVISGTYAGYVRLRPHLGDEDQTADSFLVAESGGEWTTSHRLQGVAYIYARYKWNADIWPSGPPSVSCWLRGKKIYDSRDDTTHWTPNLALIARDFLINPFLVLQTNEEHINDTETSASANVCDEMVETVAYAATITSVSGDILSIDDTNDRLYFQRGDRVFLTGDDLPEPLVDGTDYYVIPYQREGNPRLKIAASLGDALANTPITLTDTGSGAMLVTKNAEPRYHGGGTFLAGENAKSDLENILAGMAGNAVNTDGGWRIMAGAYSTPTLYLDEKDLAGGISVSTKVSRTERFNEVQGNYISPINGGQEADYPLVQRALYKTEDGIDIRKEFNLPCAQRPHTAQRVATIALDKARMDIVFVADFKLTAFPLQVGTNFYFSFPLYGWDEMVFEVTDYSITKKDNAPVISMTCRQNTADVYSWSSAYEVPVHPSARTRLLSPFAVTVVTGIGIDSKQVATGEDDITYQIELSWSAPQDSSVTSGGFFEVQYKLSADSGWKACGKVDGAATSLLIPQLEKDVYYDIRIRAFNSLGIASAWTVLEGYQAGQTVIPDAEDWESLTIAAREGDDLETDSETAEDWE